MKGLSRRQLLGAGALVMLTPACRGPHGVLRTSGLVHRTVSFGAHGSLRVHRYGLADRPARPPVLLVQDLMFGPEVFDLEGLGLARTLEARGHEVWVLDGLLGPQGMEALSLGEASERLAALGAWLEAARGPFHLVAHGFAGTLALGALGGAAVPVLRRAVAFAPVVDPYPSNPELKTVLETGGRFASLGLSSQGLQTFERLFARTALFAPTVRGKLLRRALRDVGSVAASGLRTWLEEGDLRLESGTTLQAQLGTVQIPTLVLLPLLDRITPPEMGAALRERAPRAAVRVRLLSRIDMQKEDYTHLSVLQGRYAPVDVFPEVVAWLEAA